MRTESAVEPQIGYTNSLIVNLVFDNGLPASNLEEQIYNVGFAGEDSWLSSATSDSQGAYGFSYNVPTPGSPVNLQVRVIDFGGKEFIISSTKFIARSGRFRSSDHKTPSTVTRVAVNSGHTWRDDV